MVGNNGDEIRDDSGELVDQDVNPQNIEDLNLWQDVSNVTKVYRGALNLFIPANEVQELEETRKRLSA